MGKLLVVGDSHSLFWRGHDTIRSAPFAVPGIDILHCAGATAFGLTRRNSRYYKFLEKSIYKSCGEYGAVILTFGEIDCRAHVVKHAVAAGRSAVIEAKHLAASYLGVVRALKQWGDVPVILQAPPASTPDSRFHSWPVMPTLGSETERNMATVAFTESLEDSEFPVISLLDRMICKAARSVPDTLFDGVHAASRFLPLAFERLGVSFDRRGGGILRVAGHDPAASGADMTIATPLQSRRGFSTFCLPA